MTRIYRYVVTRHGSNGANQPMTPVMVVGIYESPKPIRAGMAYLQAKENAERDLEITVYHNQYLELLSWSKASPREREAGEEAMRLLSAEHEQTREWAREVGC